MREETLKYTKTYLFIINKAFLGGELVRVEDKHTDKCLGSTCDDVNENVSLGNRSLITLLHF